MSDSPKYLVHAAFRANGVVERNDVVGAVFGQTEGLLGDDLDLRDLQQSSKVGRIDVSLDTEAGRTYGTLTIASGLDRVETAILAAALETIERVGPARARFEVDSIEDAREAKRREVVDRATELLADLEATSTTSRDLVKAVREQVRVADVNDYEGLPAGPRVPDSDAIVLVEGRSDVVTLLRYGVRNAIAVEGTDVPDALAELTADRTATAFLDGDRGGDLIYRELTQVADLDYVAFAPEGLAVEDLDRATVIAALRGKVRFDAVSDASSPRVAFYDRRTATDESEEESGAVADPQEADAATGMTAGSPAEDGTPGRAHTRDTRDEEEVVATANGGPSTGTADAGPTGETGVGPVEAASSESSTTADAAGGEATVQSDAAGADATVRADAAAGDAADTSEAAADEGESPGATRGGATTTHGSAAGGSGTAAATAEERGVDEEGAHENGAEDDSTPETLAGHVATVVGQGTETVRLLDADFAELDTDDAADAVDVIDSAEPIPEVVVLDGTLTQAVLDVAAQRGVPQVVARKEGEFVKRPTAVKTRTADEF